MQEHQTTCTPRMVQGRPWMEPLQTGVLSTWKIRILFDFLFNLNDSRNYCKPKFCLVRFPDWIDDSTTRSRSFVHMPVPVQFAIEAQWWNHVVWNSTSKQLPVWECIAFVINVESYVLWFSKWPEANFIDPKLRQKFPTKECGRNSTWDAAACLVAWLETTDNTDDLKLWWS